MAEERNTEEITEQDVRGLEAAFQVARAMGLLEPLLRKAISAHNTIRRLTVEIRDLTAQKASVAAVVAEERREATAALTADLEALRAAASQEIAAMVRDAEAQKAAAARSIEAARADGARALERLQVDIAAAQKTLKDLGVLRTQRSEALAAELAGLRADRDRAAAEIGVELDQLRATRETLRTELTTLTGEKERIRSEIAKILK